jgi:quinate dehydrogenase
MSVQEVAMSSEASSTQPRGKGVLFGHPISHSLAPLLHNTVFSNLDIPWDFDFLESKDIQEFLPILKSDDCYGKFVKAPTIFWELLISCRLRGDYAP